MPINYAQEYPIIMKVAKDYELNPEQIKFLYAIRQVENGPPGFEFGVKAAKGTDLEEQARWAAGTIKKNIGRYNKYLEGLAEGEEPMDYLEFFGNRWAPTTGDISDTEKELNPNWIPNMKAILGE